MNMDLYQNHNIIMIRGSTLDLDGNSINYNIEFIKRINDNYYEIKVYDSKYRFFHVGKSWEQIEYYNKLIQQSNLDLSYKIVEGTLSIYLEKPVNHDSMYIEEDYVSIPVQHLKYLMEQKQNLEKELEQINNTIFELKFKYNFEK